jgi:coatomer subunit beta
MSAEVPCYTVVFDDNSGDAPSWQELREGLQKGSDDVKFDTLRRIIVSTMNGNSQVGLLARVMHADVLISTVL